MIGECIPVVCDALSCGMFRMNRNRHHLMPMYNFDVGEDDARWEADLLEDDREQQMALNVCSFL